MTTMPMTLQAIAREVGLAPKTLYVLRERHASFPKWVVQIEGTRGPVRGYDLAQVVAWLEARR